MPTRRTSSFPGPDATLAIERLSSAADLTVVVGAGAAVESGLPDWSGLLSRLLSRVAVARGLKGDDVGAFVDWTLRRDGLTAAGAIVQVALGPSFLEELRAALYEGRGELAPGPTAQAVARARLELVGTDSEVVTTNYDRLLEDALEFELAHQRAAGRDLPSSLAVTQEVSGAPAGADHLVVRHLHGLLLPDGTGQGTVVLSESEYHRMQDESAWQEAYFHDRLTSSTCAFVGTSLSDPNLLRYLYRTRPVGTHLACFSRQQDAGMYDNVTPAVARCREQTVQARWVAMGVTPLRVDHFAQSAQLLFEVAGRRRLGDAYVPYADRLASWDAAMRRTVLDTRRPSRFAAGQDDLQEILADVVDAVATLLEDDGAAPADGETLGCSLWVYRPREESLVLWASSDRAWRDPDTLARVPVSWSSDLIAVRAFCGGNVVSENIPGPVTRWGHVVGAPLAIDHPEYGRLPVGVLTVASSLRDSASALGRGLGPLRGTILPELVDSVTALLVPPR